MAAGNSNRRLVPDTQGRSPQNGKHPPLTGRSQLTADESSDVVYIVDADPSIRAEVSARLAGSGNRVIAVASATEYLSLPGTEEAACVILNTCLPDISGIELQRRIVENGNPPIIFVSDNCDVASTESAMKAGALEFLTSPVDLAALCLAVRTAVSRARSMRQGKAELAELEERFRLLTPREREVLPLIVGGVLNKQAASILGISEVTLQFHRTQVMRKMHANSLAHLVRMALKLSIPPRRWVEGDGFEW